MDAPKYRIGSHIYRKDTGEYRGRFTGWYPASGTRPDGTPWPDTLLFSHSAAQSIGISADLAELRDSPPPLRKRRRV